jgi:putative peptidoglycan lipid II flippase
VFSSLSAVLALSIIISAFPVLSARDGLELDQTCAGSTRAVLLVSWLGTAVIAAIAVPAAHVLAKQPDQIPQLVAGFALLAPGLADIGVITNLSRMMFAIGRLKVAAAALAGLAAAAIGSAAGVAVSIMVPVSHKLLAAGVAVLAAGCAVIAFGAVAYLLDDGDLRTAPARLRQASWRRRVAGQQAT